MKHLPQFEIVNLDREKIAKTPPLASALQSFETSVFLLGLRRHPAALVACGSAIESAIRAVPGYSRGSEDNGMKTAIDFAIKKKPRLGKHHTYEFRTARNDFTHTGYSPEDDGRAVELLLETGFPFLNECLYTFHNISLRECVINGIWDQIEVAKGALAEMQRAVDKTAKSGTTFLSRAIEHTVMTCLRKPDDAKWTDVDFGLPDHEFAAMREFKSELESAWNFHAYVECPIPTCGSSDCLVNLDESNTGKLTPLGLFCFECKFQLQNNSQILIEHLIKTNLKNQREQILR